VHDRKVFQSPEEYLYTLKPRHTKRRWCASSPAEAHTDIRHQPSAFEEVIYSMVETEEAEDRASTLQT